MPPEPNDFYKDKLWETLFKRLDEQDKKLSDIADDVESLNRQKAYLMGIVAVISIACTMVWNWFLAKVQGGK